jgi:hypothetical protein
MRRAAADELGRRAESHNSVLTIRYRVYSFVMLVLRTLERVREI